MTSQRRQLQNETKHLLSIDSSNCIDIVSLYWYAIVTRGTPSQESTDGDVGDLCLACVRNIVSNRNGVYYVFGNRYISLTSST
jgi:hypothetical protein